MGKEIIFSEGDFTFQKSWWTGSRNILHEELEVISSGIADKHVINIGIHSNSSQLENEEDGIPFPVSHNIYDVDGACVIHGMRMCSDSLKETEEYIEALKAAVEFAKRVNAWLAQHPEWTDRTEAKKARIEAYKKD